MTGPVEVAVQLFAKGDQVRGVGGSGRARLRARPTDGFEFCSERGA